MRPQRRIQGRGGGVRWVRTNPLRPGVVVEKGRTASLYQSSSVRDIFTDIVAQRKNLKKLRSGNCNFTKDKLLENACQNAPR